MRRSRRLRWPLVDPLLIEERAIRGHRRTSSRRCLHEVRFTSSIQNLATLIALGGSAPLAFALAPSPIAAAISPPICSEFAGKTYLR